MKSILFCALAFFAFQISSNERSVTPLDVVNARMASYHNHDINGFLKTYSDNIQIYTYPNIALGKQGKEHLRRIFEPMFTEGKINVKVHQQITQGNFVINHETVTYAGKGKKYVSIYEVENGLITSVQFVRK